MYNFLTFVEPLKRFCGAPRFAKDSLGRAGLRFWKDEKHPITINIMHNDLAKAKEYNLKKLNIAETIKFIEKNFKRKIFHPPWEWSFVTSKTGIIFQLFSSSKFIFNAEHCS